MSIRGEKTDNFLYSLLPSSGHWREYLASPPPPDLFIFQFCFVFQATHSAFTPSSPLMLLPGRQWTKEPPSAGFRGRCSGGLAANKESKWRENGSWRRRTPRETRSHAKYGPGFTVVVAFLFFFFLSLCSMSPSPHVCLWFSLFMPWPALCVPPL